MAKLFEVEKKGDQILVEGSPMRVGESRSMGIGRIFLRAKGGFYYMVRVGGSGVTKYTIGLKRDGAYRLGPDYGHRIRSPEEEIDPIRRVLRQKGISFSKVRWMGAGETLEVGEFSCDIDRAYKAGTSTRHWRTDGKVEVVEEDVKSFRHINQYCGPEVHGTIRISEATYAISSGNYVQMNGIVAARLWELAIWPGCDPVKLAETLS